MNTYRTFIFAVFSLGGVVLMQNTNTPEAMGFDPGSLWQKLSPLVLGVIAVLLNDGDWPAWVKDIGNSVLKDKGADVKKGGELVDTYNKIVAIIAELKVLDANDPALPDLKESANKINKKILDGE